MKATAAEIQKLVDECAFSTTDRRQGKLLTQLSTLELEKFCIDCIQDWFPKKEKGDIQVQQNILRLFCSLSRETTRVPSPVLIEFRQTLLRVFEREHERLDGIFFLQSSPLSVLLVLCLVQASNFHLHVRELLSITHLSTRKILGLLLGLLEQEHLSLVVHEQHVVEWIFRSLYQLSLPQTHFVPTVDTMTCVTTETCQAQLVAFVMELAQSGFWTRALTKVLSLNSRSSCDNRDVLESKEDPCSTTNHYDTQGPVLNLNMLEYVFRLLRNIRHLRGFQQDEIDCDSFDPEIIHRRLWLPTCTQLVNHPTEIKSLEHENNVWTECYDNHHACAYYYNPITKESVWNIPAHRRSVRRTRSPTVERSLDLANLCFQTLSAFSFDPHPESSLRRRLLLDIGSSLEMALAHPHSLLPYFYRPLTSFFMCVINLNLLDDDDDASSSSSSLGKDSKGWDVSRLCQSIDRETQARVRYGLEHSTTCPLQRQNKSYHVLVGAFRQLEKDQEDQEGESKHWEEEAQAKEAEVWEGCLDEASGSVYYYNPETHESFWEKPGPLPQDWTRVWCSDYDRYYFVNLVTNESTWTRPTEEEKEESPLSEDKQQQSPSSSSEHKDIEPLESKTKEDKDMDRLLESKDSTPASPKSPQGSPEKKDSRAKETKAKFRLLGDLPALCPPKGPPPSKAKISGKRPHKSGKSGESRPRPPRSPPRPEKKKASDVPKEFLCGINQCLMIHPLRSRYGHVFDSASIQQWFQMAGHICPLTQLPLVSLPISVNRFRSSEGIHIF